MRTETVSTFDLREGDIVHNHRRMRITNRQVFTDSGEDVVTFDGEFLDDQPIGWPRWADGLGVQGNSRATWFREIPTD